MLGHGGVCAQGVLDRHRTLELVLGQEPARKQSRLFLPFEEDVELIYQNLGEVEGGSSMSVTIGISNPPVDGIRCGASAELRPPREPRKRGLKAR